MKYKITFYQYFDRGGGFIAKADAKGGPCKCSQPHGGYCEQAGGKTIEEAKESLLKKLKPEAFLSEEEIEI